MWTKCIIGEGTAWPITAPKLSTFMTYSLSKLREVGTHMVIVRDILANYGGNAHSLGGSYSVHSRVRSASPSELKQSSISREQEMQTEVRVK